MLGKLLCKVTQWKDQPADRFRRCFCRSYGARVSQKVGAEADPTNFLLMHAMGPNVAGVIGTAVAAGTFMAIFWCLTHCLIKKFVRRIIMAELEKKTCESCGNCSP